MRLLLGQCSYIGTMFLYWNNVILSLLSITVLPNNFALLSKKKCSDTYLTKQGNKTKIKLVSTYRKQNHLRIHLLSSDKNVLCSFGIVKLFVFLSQY